MVDQRTQGGGATIIGVVGIVMYVVVAFVYLISGLTVPPPWLFILWAIWVVGLYPLFKVFRTRRIWTPMVAIAAVGIWFVYLYLGGYLFNWTA